MGKWDPGARTAELDVGVSAAPGASLVETSAPGRCQLPRRWAPEPGEPGCCSPLEAPVPRDGAYGLQRWMGLDGSWAPPLLGMSLNLI